MGELRREIVFEREGPSTCFGCGKDNPRGLGLRFDETEDGVEVLYSVDEDFGGAPGVVHGGIQATLLDEALCMAAYAKEDTPVVTGELTVRYEHPLPTSTPLRIRSRITERRGSSFFAEAEIFVGEDVSPATRARARLFPFPAD